MLGAVASVVTTLVDTNGFCQDSTADNYGMYAQKCVPKIVGKCNVKDAANYQDLTGEMDVAAPWVCQYYFYGCADETADNYVSAAAKGYPTKPAFPYFKSVPSMCQYGGCNDTGASNFDTKATYND